MGFEPAVRPVRKPSAQCRRLDRMALLAMGIYIVK
jgi:hypothetical protein